PGGEEDQPADPSEELVTDPACEDHVSTPFLLWAIPLGYLHAPSATLLLLNRMSFDGRSFHRLLFVIMLSARVHDERRSRKERCSRLVSAMRSHLLQLRAHVRQNFAEA